MPLSKSGAAGWRGDFQMQLFHAQSQPNTSSAGCEADVSAIHSDRSDSRVLFPLVQWEAVLNIVSNASVEREAIKGGSIRPHA
jgi:hypothetical protein